MRAGLALAVTLTVVAIEARAETIPEFDISLYCASISPAPLAPATCRKGEEARRSQVLAQWESFPQQRRHFCLQTIAFLKKEQRSYSPLWQCLEEAKPAKTS